MKTWAWTAAAAAVALLSFAIAGRAAPPGSGNGVIGLLNGQGGDPALGATLYAVRCVSCHDHPAGRTPPKATIADNTRVFIAAALSDGVMRSMARGLSPHDVASLAA